MTFAETAARAAGMAGAAFGWSPGAFWAATPAELAAVARALTGEGADGCDAATIARLKEQFPDG